MRHYMVYWKPSTVRKNEGCQVDHSASNQYGRHIAVGDVLWIVTSEGPNDLKLVARQHVDRIVDGQAEAEQLLQRPLWEARYHVISESVEPVLNLDISRWASELSFDGANPRLPENFTGRNFQQLRRLHVDSASLLERLWRAGKDQASVTA